MSTADVVKKFQTLWALLFKSKDKQQIQENETTHSETLLVADLTLLLKMPILMLQIVNRLPSKDRCTFYTLSTKFRNFCEKEIFPKRLVRGYEGFDAVLRRVLLLDVYHMNLAHVELKDFPKEKTEFKLLSLKLSNVRPMATVHRLLEYCTHLKELYLAECEFGDATCDRLIRLKYLRLLSIVDCKLPPKISFHRLSPAFAKLAELKVHLNPDSGEYVEFVKSLFRSLSTFLLKLDIFGSKHVVDQDVLELTHSCPMLQELGLQMCQKLTEKSLVYISENLPHLESLYISEFDSLKFNYVVAFCENLKHLRFFYLKHADDRLKYLKTRLPSVDVQCGPSVSSIGQSVVCI